MKPFHGMTSVIAAGTLVFLAATALPLKSESSSSKEWLDVDRLSGGIAAFPHRDEVGKSNFLRLVRDSRCDPSLAVPFLRRVLQDKKASSFVRSLSIEALKQMDQGAASSALDLAAILTDETQDPMLAAAAAEAVPQIVSLAGKPELRHKLAEALGSATSRSNVNENLRWNAIDSLGALGFDSKNNLEPLILILESQKTEPKLYSLTASALAKIASSLRGRASALGLFERLIIYRQLERGAHALKRNGATAVSAEIQLVDQTLKSFKEDEEVPTPERWLLRFVVANFGLAACLIIVIAWMVFWLLTWSLLFFTRKQAIAATLRVFERVKLKKLAVPFFEIETPSLGLGQILGWFFLVTPFRNSREIRKLLQKKQK